MSDGYTDLAQHHRMTFEFDEARNGNVALTGELNLSKTREFTVGLALGETLLNVVATLFQALGSPYKERRQVFMCQWQATPNGRMALEKASGDQDHLFDASYNLLLSHEDKVYPGAFVASLSIPWGSARNDENGKGGYHLVWTRDMVETAMGLLAAGNTDAPLRALIYLAARQEEDGSFPQNFWVSGDAFRSATQLDEIAFPILLASRLHKMRLLGEFNAIVMVKRAAAFLLQQGPVTGEERWEEAAVFLESYADFLRAHLADWTVTTKGSLVPGIPRHFARMNPAKPGESAEPHAVDSSMLGLADQPPGTPYLYPARDIVDAGFLQLVRYGVLAADDPLIVDSLRVGDEIKVDTPGGPCWHRYNHNGYGQRSDRFSNGAGLLPEQIWDEDDRPEANMRRGGPTGSANPLLWAHSEYLRLLRSAHDARVFDLIPDVAEGYCEQRARTRVEFWQPNHPIGYARKGYTLRICASRPFRLRWAQTGNSAWQDAESRPSRIAGEYVDIQAKDFHPGVESTLFWKGRNAWEGRNYRVLAY